MKIALCQINPTVGAIDSNKNKILEFYKKALSENSDIVVFPELAITGYPPQDLLLDEDFIELNNVAINSLAKKATNPLIVGYVRKENNQMFNSAALCKDGEIVNNYDKILLPTYDVFDESRYFTQGTWPTVWPITFNGKKVKIGIQICEDLWDDGYDKKVSYLQKQKGADFLINISPPIPLSNARKTNEIASSNVIKNLVISGFVIVISLPSIICLLNNGITDPLE